MSDYDRKLFELQQSMKNIHTVEEAARILLETWDANNPGDGSSWDDCVSDIEPCIEKLREMVT